MVWLISDLQEVVRISARILATGFPVRTCQSEKWRWHSEIRSVPPLTPNSHSFRRESLANSLHKSATAPLLLSWLTEITVRRISSTVSSLPLKWIDFLPFPLLLNSALSKAPVARNTGCPLSAKLSIKLSAVLFHSPSGLWVSVPYHFFSHPSPRNDQHPCGISREYSLMVTESAIQFSLFPRSLHIKSLYIDIKMIHILIPPSSVESDWGFTL